MADVERKIEIPGRHNDIGYRATWTGENVTRENARIAPIDPKRQEQFEAVVWKLRPTDDEGSA